ncbi:MAG: translocation/assembly module TamB domain-containing protein, partial [Pseudomonadota bacterium]
LLGVPLADGEIVAQDAEVGSFALEALSVRSETVEDRMNIGAEARLENGTEAAVRAAVTNLSPGVEVSLNRLRLVTASQDLALQAPTRLTVIDGEVDLSRLVLEVGEGRLEVEGQSGETLALDLLMRAVPLGLVNDIVPGLGVGGTVSGSAAVSGTPEAPSADFDLRAAGVTAAALEQFGLPAIDLEARGTSTDQVMDVSGTVNAGEAVGLSIDGSVPLQPDQAGLDLEIALRSLALSALDQLAGGQGLTGTLEGSAAVTGSLSDPRAAFSVTGSGLGARILRENGLGTAEAQLSGSYAAQTVEIEELVATGTTALRLRASGRVPLTGTGLNVQAEGQVPLALANPVLARQQAQANGVIQVSVQATGALADPQLTGDARLEGGSFASQPLNLRLDNIVLDARLTGDAIVLDQASAALATGGRLTLGGRVGIAPQSGFPADLRLQLVDGVYTDGEILTTRVDIDLALTGPLTGGASVAGEVDLRRTEISIPKSFGLNEGVLLDVDHFEPPRDVILTLDRAGLREEEAAPSNPVAIGLDVLVRAPNEIFIRGRGLDAELGGQIRLRGSTVNVVPVGSIDLIRGRLGILGQRIDLDEGGITLLGTLNPQIRLVAETTSRDGTLITITVAGSAADPQITFSSSPELPQDEVLAQLIFDRSVSDLSAFQIAQLALAANTLAGGGSGVANQFRGAAGLADFDVTSGEEGEVGVRAGAYIDDNIYLDVEADSAGGTKATINLDITQTVRARASVDNEGDSTIGIFFERDY